MIDWSAEGSFANFPGPILHILGSLNRQNSLPWCSRLEQVNNAVMVQPGFHNDGWVLYECIRSVQVGDGKSTSVQCLSSGKDCLGLASLMIYQNLVLFHQLGFLLKPRKLSSPLHACSTFLYLKSSIKDAPTICLMLVSSQFSMLVRWDCLVLTVMFAIHSEWMV